MVRAGKFLAKTIERHCDGFEDISVEWDTKVLCSFCKRQYEEDAEGPLCCDAAVTEWKAQKEVEICRPSEDAA